MKHLLHGALSLCVFSAMYGNACAKEDEPLEKIKLAIGEADLVLPLAEKATEEDPQLDKMCLRLGRFSAILRRVRDSIPVPPEELRQHYVHYENFCGWAPRNTDAPVENLLPRGYSADPKVTLEHVKKLFAQLKSDRDHLEAWRKAQVISCKKTIDGDNTYTLTLSFQDDKLEIAQTPTERFALINYKLRKASVSEDPPDTPNFSCKSDTANIAVWKTLVRVNKSYYNTVL